MNARSHGLDISSIIRILPHKPPAVLIDKIVELAPGQMILARKNITLAESAFAGHFPGMPIYPAAYLLEVMLQACTILSYATAAFDSMKQVVSLVGINKTKFYKAVKPGDVLDIECELTQRRSNVWRFRVQIFVDDLQIVESGLVLSVQNRSDIV